jgi:uncharacterized membrane protein YqjE
MEPAANKLGEFGVASKHLARRLLIIGENRLELLLVEAQEERERLLRAIVLAFGMAVFGFLTGAALTVAVVVLLWHFSPVVILLVLAAGYATIAGLLYRRLMHLKRGWKTFPATLDQLSKDRVCFQTILE